MVGLELKKALGRRCHQRTPGQSRWGHTRLPSRARLRCHQRPEQSKRVIGHGKKQQTPSRGAGAGRLWDSTRKAFK